MEVWELREGFGLEHLRKAKRPDPAPGPGEVLLMMQAASLNYRDTLVVRGGYGPRYTLPLIPVSDGVGEVVAVGGGIRRDELQTVFLILASVSRAKLPRCRSFQARLRTNGAWYRRAFRRC